MQNEPDKTVQTHTITARSAADVLSDTQRQAKLYAALARFNAELKRIVKDKTVTVRPRDQSKAPYTFSYAQLETILAEVRPLLAKHGLSVLQLVEGSKVSDSPNRGSPSYWVTTRLVHEDGGFVEAHAPLAYQGGSPQEFGSAVSYLRRYQLSAILCISPDDDDDANIAEGNHFAPGVRESRGGAPRAQADRAPSPRAAQAPQAGKQTPQAGKAGAIDPASSRAPIRDTLGYAPPDWRPISRHARHSADLSLVDTTGVPQFFAEKVPIGKRAKQEGWTWGDMVDGGAEGERVKFLEWLARDYDPYTDAAGAPKNPRFAAQDEINVARAQACLLWIQDRLADASNDYASADIPTDGDAAGDHGDGQ